MLSVAYCDRGNILRPLAGHDQLLHCDCFLNDIGGVRGERRSKHFCYHLLVRSSQPQPSITQLIIEAGFIAPSTIAVVKRGETEREAPRYWQNSYCNSPLTEHRTEEREERGRERCRESTHWLLAVFDWHLKAGDESLMCLSSECVNTCGR